jgi:hypothetical protein
MNFLKTHLGLGDHVITNGLLRHFYEKYGELGTFAKSGNMKNVSYMFRDLKNLKIIPAESPRDINEYVSKNSLDMIDASMGPSPTFDQSFYLRAGVDFSVRFDKFYIQRDKEKESKVTEALNPKNEKYIFVADHPSRGFSIDMSKVRNDYKIIKNDMKFNLFHYISLLEGAEEIHFMQTAFKDLICSYKMDKPKLFQHNYVRKYPPHYNSLGINIWTEIN